MKYAFSTLILLAMASMPAYADAENASEEVELVATTLAVVGETEFSPVLEGSETIIIDEAEREEFSVIEATEAE